MKCLCGHSDTFHEEMTSRRLAIGPCEECECTEFRIDPNWEPADPEGWEGGFAENH